MKKKLALILAATMMVGALAGCGEGGAELLTSSDEPGVRARMRALLAAEL